MSESPAAYRLSPEHRPVFLGLLLGMFVASVSQMIVGPAIPIIVADLGGMDHYPWVATAAMLASAVIVPIIGKLSDLYGRRTFYLAGLVVFMLGALVCGLAPNFWVLVAGRAIQGMGMGTIMPLSQTIVGDIVPARYRGKYQGFMGATFGVSSIAGPIVGGFITDLVGWRGLFFMVLPLGVVAFFVIGRFLTLQHNPRRAKIDVAGVVTLAPSLVALLLATSWGGSTFPWLSFPVLGCYIFGVIGLIAFALVERRAPEPILPLGMLRNRVILLSNLSAFCVAMVMFGTIIYIPVFVQGVMGYSAAESGLILVPLMLSNIVFGVVAGYFISATGRYKALMAVGLVLMGISVVPLSQLSVETQWWELLIAIIAMGIGLGLVFQQYMLLVQNASSQKNLGVATSSTQFFRNIGSTVGITIFGTIMNAGLSSAIAAHLPADVVDGLGDTLEDVDAGALIGTQQPTDLPPEILEALRHALSDQLSTAFLLGIPLILIALIATLAIPNLPLRETLSEPSKIPPGGDEVVPGMGHSDKGARTRERLLALRLQLLEAQTHRAECELLRQAVAELAHGELEHGRALLLRTAAMLSAEDAETVINSEKYAAALAKAAARPGGILSEEMRKELAVRVTHKDRAQVLSGYEPAVTDSYEAVNLADLREATNDLSTVLVLDLTVNDSATAERSPSAG